MRLFDFIRILPRLLRSRILILLTLLTNRLSNDQLRYINFILHQLRYHFLDIVRDLIRIVLTQQKV